MAGKPCALASCAVREIVTVIAVAVLVTFAALSGG